MLKKLPIGIQTFSKLREENYIYIDKTDIAYHLIENNQSVFLSRPRRFGKSLFLDTLKNIFEGKKEHFKGLAIEDKWDWGITYPVIKISFSGDLRSGKSVKNNILATLRANQKRLEVVCEDRDNYDVCFKELIENTFKKYDQKVVILIDEYDKAILDNLDQMEVAKEAREIIRGFYSIIKDSDEYLRFVFLTGVSKFNKSSIFSGLNMLKDISLNPKYGNICGYTQANVENEFLPYLKGVDLQKVKEWYNGYNFLKDDMYNPFDLLLFIDNDYMFKDYWFSTGTPTFLIKLIEKNRYFIPNFLNLRVGEKLLDSFDIDNLDLEVILYQAGYLTIDKMINEDNFIEYELKIPNVEVKRSLNDYIITSLTQNTNPNTKKLPIYKAIKNADMAEFENRLKSMFASIPYNNFTNNHISNYEGYYASVIYAYLASLGLEIIGEDVTNKGRIDLTVFVEDKIYIIEFKVGSSDALKQIKDRKYYKKYLDKNREIYLVGINFDESEKNISNFECEKVSL